MGSEHQAPVVATAGGKSALWDRRRERRLWQFYLAWVTSPLAGFRRRWESVVFYLGLMWVAVGKWVVSRLPLDITQEDLLWQIPLAAIGLIGAYRFILFPANEIQRLKTSADEAQAAAAAAHARTVLEANARHAAILAERDAVGAEGAADKAKWLAERKRPRVTIEMVGSHIKNSPAQVIAHNDQDAALNISALCQLSTIHAIRLGPVSRVGAEPVPVPLSLMENGRGLDYPIGPVTYEFLSEFINKARTQVLFDVSMALHNERNERPATTPTISADEELERSDKELKAALAERGLLPSREFVISFDVTYADFALLRYRTPHVLRHSNADRYMRIEAAEVPEPEPTRI